MQRPTSAEATLEPSARELLEVREHGPSPAPRAPARTSDASPRMVPPWRPRVGANHLAKGPGGVWYLRLVIPDRVRLANPDLPRELKRSTKQVQKRAALTQARQMCLQLITSINPPGPSMLATEMASKQAFSIQYVDGAISATPSPSANSETRLLLSRVMVHVLAQVLGRVVRDDSPTSSTIALTPNFPAHSSPSTPEPAAAIASAETLPVGDGETETPDGHPVWLSDAIERWRTDDGRAFSETSWKHSYRPTFRIFRELIGNERRDITTDEGVMLANQLDRRIGTINRADIVKLYELLKSYPERQGKRQDGVEALERIANAKANKWRVQSPANVEKLLRHIKPFLVHMEAAGWVQAPLSAEMKMRQEAATQRIAKSNKAKGLPKKGAVALSVEELKRTYEQPAYLDEALEWDWAYFIDPIRLYEGARVSEVAQTYIEDIVDVDGVPCISFVADVTEDPDDEPEAGANVQQRRVPTTEAEFRRLKNQASRRIVPVHPALIDMGFLDFVEHRRLVEGRGDTLLFSGLKWEEKSGYGRKPSQHTLKLLKQAGVWQKRRKVGHSLRSNAAQEFKNVGMDPDLIQRVLGHSTGKMHDEAYGENEHGAALPVQRVLEFMRKTNFGISFPKWSEMSRLQTDHARARQARLRGRTAQRKAV